MSRDRKIREQAQQAIKQASKDYLASLEQKIADGDGDLRLSLQLYRQFIQTKRVDEQQRERARQAIAEIQRQRLRMWSRQVALGLLLAIFIGYLAWEYFGYRQAHRAITLLASGEILPDHCRQQLRHYQSSWSPLRSWWLGARLVDELAAAKAQTFAAEKQKCRQLISAGLPQAPEQTADLAGSAPEVIAKEIEIAQAQSRRYEGVWRSWQNWQKRWPDNSELWPQQIAELQQQWRRWLHYTAKLRHIYEYGIQMQQIRRQYSGISDPAKMAIPPEINLVRRQLPGIVAQAREMVGKIQSLVRDCRSYLQRYPQTPFAGELREIIADLEQRRQHYTQLIANLMAVKDLWQKLSDVAGYTVPESSHIENIEQVETACRNIKEARKTIKSDRGQWNALLQKYRQHDCPLLVLAIESHIFRFDRLLQNWKEYEQKVLMQREQVTDKQLRMIGHELCRGRTKESNQTARENIGRGQPESPGRRKPATARLAHGQRGHIGANGPVFARQRIS